MDSDSLTDIAHVLPPAAKAKLRKSPARAKAQAPAPEKQGTAEAPIDVELVEVKREPDAPTTGETLPPQMREPVREPAPVCLIALQPQQVMEVALLAALLAVGLYKALEGLEGLVKGFFDGVSETLE